MADRTPEERVYDAVVAYQHEHPVTRTTVETQAQWRFLKACFLKEVCAAEQAAAARALEKAGKAWEGDGAKGPSRVRVFLDVRAQRIREGTMKV